jgi:hypothetical protein
MRRGIQNLTKIFANFHKILIPNQSSTIHDDNEPMSIKNLITYILQTDKRVFPRVIFSLATGYIDYSQMKNRKHITRQSALLSTPKNAEERCALANRWNNERMKINLTEKPTAVFPLYHRLLWPCHTATGRAILSVAKALEKVMPLKRIGDLD